MPSPPLTLNLFPPWRKGSPNNSLLGDNGNDAGINGAVTRCQPRSKYLLINSTFASPGGCRVGAGRWRAGSRLSGPTETRALSCPWRPQVGLSLAP